MKGVTFISAHTEERPGYFEFRKRDVVGHHPAMANVTYDPFPDAGDGDVVRKEIIRRELVLIAKLKGAVDSIYPGILVPFKGYSFAVQKVTEDINLVSGSDEYVMDVEATVLLFGQEPIKVLEELRKSLAASNPKNV